VKEARDKERIFANTREMLELARAGLADATGPDPRRRRPGLMNLFTYGRSVTLAIQTMRNTDPGFEDWWRPYQDRMAGDSLMRYFNNRRTDIVHEGELRTGSYTVIGSQGPVDMGALMQELSRDAPPNTESIFLGDPLGGNGWEVRMPDGTLEKVYFDLPQTADVTSGLTLDDPPTEHDGQAIADPSIQNLGQLYIDVLTRTVEDFIARFSEEAPAQPS
jgi:hypothetical protein